MGPPRRRLGVDSVRRPKPWWIAAIKPKFTYIYYLLAKFYTDYELYVELYDRLPSALISVRNLLLSGV
jgi:hypothetical protein